MKKVTIEITEKGSIIKITDGEKTFSCRYDADSLEEELYGALRYGSILDIACALEVDPESFAEELH